MFTSKTTELTEFEKHVILFFLTVMSLYVSEKPRVLFS